MKKSTISLLLGAMLAVTATAETLTPTEALLRAQSSIPQSLKAKMPALRSAKSAELVYTVADSLTAEPAVYAFNQGGLDDGFVIVSADDRAVPLLGCSETGCIDPDNMPPALEYWLWRYQQQIKNAPNRRTPAHWPGNFGRPVRQDVDPLCSTKWDQDAPYNNSCPKVGTTSTFTGCVATAMAQVMKFWEYPTKGTGSHSYTWNKKSLSMTFSNTTFDWANMLDVYSANSYTTTQGTAVATLMKACGYSTDMGYGTDGSGTATGLVIPAMIDYFGYDSGAYFSYASIYSLIGWEDKMYGQLYDTVAKQPGHPVQMSGSNPTGGHSFVCDGIRMSCQFHFNWGWGGMSNGWFMMSALDPDAQGIGGSAAGYNDTTGACFDIFPTPSTGATAPKQNLMECPYPLYPEVDTSGNLIIKGFFTNTGAYAEMPAQSYIRIYATENKQGGTTTNLMNIGVDGLPQGSLYPKLTINASQYFSNLSDGIYVIELVFCDYSNQQQWMMPVPYTQQGYILVQIQSHKATAALAPVTWQPSVTNIESQTPYYCGHNFTVVPTVHSDADDVMTANLVLGIVSGTDQTQLVCNGYTMSCELYPGDNTFTVNESLPAAAQVPPGNYYLCYMWSEGNIFDSTNGSYPIINKISDFYPITILADPGTPNTVNGTSGIQNSQAVDWCGMKIDYTIINGTQTQAPRMNTARAAATTGLFDRPLRFRIYEYGTTNLLTELQSPIVYVPNGQTVSGTFETKWEDATPATQYTGKVFYAGTDNYLHQLGNTFNFKTAGTTSIGSIGADKGRVALTPNPVEDMTLLTAEADITGVEAYGLDGTPAAIGVEFNGTRATVDASALTAGVYLLRVTTIDGDTDTLRLIKR